MEPLSYELIPKLLLLLKKLIPAISDHMRLGVISASLLHLRAALWSAFTHVLVITKYSLSRMPALNSGLNRDVLNKLLNISLWSGL
jgi:hypothetical protein